MSSTIKRSIFALLLGVGLVAAPLSVQAAEAHGIAGGGAAHVGPASGAGWHGGGAGGHGGGRGVAVASVDGGGYYAGAPLLCSYAPNLCAYYGVGGGGGGVAGGAAWGGAPGAAGGAVWHGPNNGWHGWHGHGGPWHGWHGNGPWHGAWHRGGGHPFHFAGGHFGGHFGGGHFRR